jgi:hypothetical protein
LSIRSVDDGFIINAPDAQTTVNGSTNDEVRRMADFMIDDFGALARE